MQKPAFLFVAHSVTVVCGYLSSLFLEMMLTKKFFSPSFKNSIFKYYKNRWYFTASRQEKWLYNLSNCLT